MIRKLVINNGRSERELLLVGSIVIGRDPACHVSEPDPLLSRRHAEILANVHGVSIRDLNSRNGLLVNGEKAREQILFPGDVVQMGHLQLRYVEESARPADTMVERSPVRRPLPPEPLSPASTRPAEGGLDRFRAEPPNAPGRWKPEPTPLPGRKTTAPPPRTRYPQPNTPVPRGRAAFPDAPPPPARHPDPFEQTIAARSPLAPERPHGSGSVPFDQTAFDQAALNQSAFDETFEQTMIAPAPPLRRPVDDTVLGSPAGFETTLGPGHAAFDSALEHLSGFAQSGAEDETAVPLEGDAAATLTANAELTITDATHGCAELLGIPDEQLIGDSLTDVFLRAVRRAYAQPGATMSLSVTRGAHGMITVAFYLQQNGGTE